MTVNTSIGTITADPKVLNTLAIALSQADERNIKAHGKRDCFQFRTSCDEIFIALNKTVFYDDVK